VRLPLFLFPLEAIWHADSGFRSSPSLTGKNSETGEGIGVEATAVDVGRMLPQEGIATAKLS
jgi:hypothetical protein